ncbi:MAG: dNTP triphosphohydrolase [Phycisphaerales bacterium]|nr:dNTP triphosphohydrolase [Phycisphaerales bacterium]
MYDLRRDHPEPTTTILSPLALDRQRIVHSAAFRRLQHKTQVFVAPESDHFRTRLTHTLEVAHQARCLAHTVGLSADLAEVVALAHDLGHPPFGHAGEVALAACLQACGGFEHNRHTLRIVEELEHPYPAFRGLNLTRAVRACLAGHGTPFDHPDTHLLHAVGPPPPESRVVDLADRLTFALHDLQDALYAGLLQPSDLRGLVLWQTHFAGSAGDAPSVWRSCLRSLVDGIQAQVLQEVGSRSVAVRAGNSGLSAGLEADLAALEQLLLTRVYRGELLTSADAHAQLILRDVFVALVAEPHRMPPRFSQRIASAGTERVVADYVAGMTDRFCIEEHARLYGDGMARAAGEQ